MATQWFYNVMGDEFGPCSPAELKEQAALGNIRQDSLVRKGTDGQWVSAWRVKGLFDHAPQQPAATAVAEPPTIAQAVPVARPAPPPVPEPKPIVPELQLQTQAKPVPAQPRKTRKKRRSKWLIFALVLVVLIPAYSWLRNNGVRVKLRSCPTYGTVEADVYYDRFFSSDVVVFDLLDGGSSSARRIDPVHLVLQFSDKLDLYSVHRVILARNGREVFYISSTDLKRLSDSYAGGGRLWAFNHFPESVCTMSGHSAYDQWTGGWLGVLQKQTEDLNDFIREWTGY